MFHSSNQHIIVYTPATDTWNTLDTPVYDFALTTYRSKLVLVGGGEKVVGSPSNKLLTLSEDGEWEETLPPMETACGSGASAVSHGDHLLVVDGNHKEVHVYNGHHWAKAQHLPEILRSVKSTIFNGDLYVSGLLHNTIYSASLDSLIASSQPSENSAQPSTVWKRLPDLIIRRQSLAVFRDKLITVGFNITVGYNAIYSYSSSDQSWEYVSAIPLASWNLFSPVVLSLNELIVIGESGPVFKGTLNGEYSNLYQTKQ